MAPVLPLPEEEAAAAFAALLGGLPPAAALTPWGVASRPRGDRSPSMLTPLAPFESAAEAWGAGAFPGEAVARCLGVALLARCLFASA